MKLERLNENQIRCTLSKSDLEQRQLRLSELAYGSAKARELFHDMIQQASAELGFEAENIPLMIEAIPISNECLILVVTKVEDPEELDTRFSRFSRLSEYLRYLDDDEDDDYPDSYTDTDQSDDDSLSFSDLEDDPDFTDSSFDPLGLIAPFTQAIAEAKKEALKKKKEQSEDRSQTRLFVFHDLDPIISLSAFLVPFYQGGSILYKDPDASQYYLFLKRENSSGELFGRACMIASEYGQAATSSYASLSFCREHCQLMFQDSALQTLNQLNA